MENKIYVLYKDYDENIYADYSDVSCSNEVIAASPSKEKLMELAREKVQAEKEYLVNDLCKREDTIEITEVDDREITLISNVTRYQFYIDSVDLV